MFTKVSCWFIIFQKKHRLFVYQCQLFVYTFHLFVCKFQLFVYTFQLFGYDLTEIFVAYFLGFLAHCAIASSKLLPQWLQTRELLH